MAEIDPEVWEDLMQKYNELSDAFIKFSIAANKASAELQRLKPLDINPTLFDH